MTTLELDPAAISSVIDAMCATGQAIGETGERIEIREFAVTAEAGTILEAAAAAAPPGAAVEVGCASGLSTLLLCRGRLRAHTLASGSVHVCDPKQTSHWKGIGRRAIAQAGLDAVVTLVEEPAHVALPRLLDRDLRVAFAFIDGWHMLDYVCVEAFYCDLMMEVGGVLALHDLWMPALQHFASFWCANRAYEPVVVGAASRLDAETPHSLSTSHGCGDLDLATPCFRERLAPFVDQSVLLLRKVGEDRRTWQEFVEFAR